MSDLSRLRSTAGDFEIREPRVRWMSHRPVLAQVTSTHLDGLQNAPLHEKSKITGRRRLAHYRKAKSLGSLARGDDSTRILPWRAARRARTVLTADTIAWTLLGQMPCEKGAASDLIWLAPTYAGREHLNIIQHNQVLRGPILGRQ